MRPLPTTPAPPLPLPASAKVPITPSHRPSSSFARSLTTWTVTHTRWSSLQVVFSWYPSSLVKARRLLICPASNKSE